MEQPEWQSRVDNGTRAGSAAQPEILPPGAIPEPAYYGGPQPMAPPRRQRSAWQLAPATHLLMGINIGVFLLMVLRGVSATTPSGEQLVRWGANVGVLVLGGHEWWRLITATFVHAGIIHLATNMWCLYNLGLLGEPLLGSLGLVAAYLLTGIMGNLLSVAVHPGAVSGGYITDLGVVGVGASGAVFGLAGVLILLLGSRLLPVDRGEVRRLRRSVIYFAFLNFAIGFGTDVFRAPVRIDNMAHLGGFLSGLALGVPLVPKLGAERSLWLRRQWLAFGGVLLLALLGAHFISSFWHE
jgi:rhomboid protease GluP